MRIKGVSGWLPNSIIFGASIYGLVEENVTEAA